MKNFSSKATELTQFPNGFLFGVSNNKNLTLFQRFIAEELKKTGKLPQKLSGIFLASNNTDSNRNLAPDLTSKNPGHFLSVVAVLDKNNQYQFVINNPLGGFVKEDHKKQFAENISKQLVKPYEPDDIEDVSWSIQGKNEQKINSLGCGPLAIADSATISERINSVDEINKFQSTTALEDEIRETRARIYHDQIQEQRALTNRVLENKDVANLTDIVTKLKALKNHISLYPNDEGAIMQARALIGNLSDPFLLSALEGIKQDIEANKNKIDQNIANEFALLNRENNLKSLPSFGLGAMLITGPFVGLNAITDIVGQINLEMFNWVAELRDGADEVFDWLSDNTGLFREISTEINLLRESTVLKDGTFALDYLIPPTELVTSVGALYGIDLVADAYKAKARNAKQIKDKLLEKEADAKEQLKQKSRDSYDDRSAQVLRKTGKDLNKLAPKSKSPKPETKQQKSKSSSNDSRSLKRDYSSDNSKDGDDGAENSEKKTVLFNIDNNIDYLESVPEKNQAGPKPDQAKAKEKNLKENSEYSSDFEDYTSSNDKPDIKLPQSIKLQSKQREEAEAIKAERARKEREEEAIKAKDAVDARKKQDEDVKRKAEQDKKQKEEAEALKKRQEDKATKPQPNQVEINEKNYIDYLEIIKESKSLQDWEYSRGIIHPDTSSIESIDDNINKIYALFQKEPDKEDEVQLKDGGYITLTLDRTLLKGYLEKNKIAISDAEPEDLISKISKEIADERNDRQAAEAKARKQQEAAQDDARKQREEEEEAERAKQQQLKSRIDSFLTKQKETTNLSENKNKSFDFNSTSNHFDWWMFPSFTKNTTQADFHVDHNSADGQEILKGLWDSNEYIKNYLEFTRKYLNSIKSKNNVELYETRFCKMVQSLVGFNKVADINEKTIHKANKTELRKLISEVGDYIKKKHIKPSGVVYSKDFQEVKAQSNLEQIDTNAKKQNQTPIITKDEENEKVGANTEKQKISDILTDFGLKKDQGNLSIDQQDMSEAMRRIFENNKKMDEYRLDPIRIDGIDGDGFTFAEYSDKKDGTNDFKSDEQWVQPSTQDLLEAKTRLATKIKEKLENNKGILENDCVFDFKSNGHEYQLKQELILNLIRNNESALVDFLNKPKIHFIKRGMVMEKKDIIQKAEQDPNNFKVILSLTPDNTIVDKKSGVPSIFKYEDKIYKGENNSNNALLKLTEAKVGIAIEKGDADFQYKEVELKLLYESTYGYKDKGEFKIDREGVIKDPILGERKITHFTVHEGDSINGGHYFSYQLGADNQWYKFSNNGSGDTKKCEDNPLANLNIKQNICSYVTLPHNVYQNNLPEVQDLLGYKTPNRSNFCFLLAMINQINFLPDKDREAILKESDEFLQMSKYIEKKYGKPLFYMDDTSKRLVTNDLAPAGISEIINRLSQSKSGIFTDSNKEKAVTNTNSGGGGRY